MEVQNIDELEKLDHVNVPRIVFVNHCKVSRHLSVRRRRVEEARRRAAVLFERFVKQCNENTENDEHRDEYDDDDVCERGEPGVALPTLEAVGKRGVVLLRGDKHVECEASRVEGAKEGGFA
eukprot:1917605-Pleurochrysis_carterae.AAC.1